MSARGRDHKGDGVNENWGIVTVFKNPEKCPVLHPRDTQSASKRRINVDVK